MSDKRLLVVNHISPHHAQKSGMKGILEYLPAHKITPVGGVPYRLQRLVANGAQSSYGTDGFRKELAVLKYMLHNRQGIVHFLNGEPEFHYAGIFSHLLGWKVTATFHKPPAILRDLFPDTHFLRRLDGVFCVGSNQRAFFDGILPSDHIWFVPLGVDTDFFRPIQPMSSDQKTCLFVGVHMRDFEMLGKVLLKLRQRVKGVRMIAVLPQKYAHLLPPIPELELLSGISDEALRDVYSSASFLLQPLQDSTANCSILEALACGLPVVSNDIGGVRDYMDQSCGFICKNGAVDDMVDSAICLLEDVELNVRMRNAARSHALAFSWPRIANIYLNIYKKAFGIDFR